MFFVMKKLLPIFALSFLLLCGCNTIKDTCTTSDCLPEDWEQEIGTETEVENYESNSLEDAVINYIETNFDCKDWSKLFVNFVELWGSWFDWRGEYYILATAEWFYIDKRWNLSDTCWFSIPMKLTYFTEDWTHYKILDSIQARDWSDYDISLHEMFPDKVIDILYKWNYEYRDSRTHLEMAEEYFWVKIIPEVENQFECKFCDKLRYYNPTPEDDETIKETNELHFNYISENNWENTIYFWSDWTFEAKWSRDAWKWIRVFWQNENTIIVLNENSDHVYNRYIITNVDENNLNTILEIIQK